MQTLQRGFKVTGSLKLQGPFRAIRWHQGREVAMSGSSLQSLQSPSF